MHDGARPVGIEDRAQGVSIGDAGFNEAVARVFLELRQGVDIGRVSQLVQIDDDIVGLREQMPDHRRSDKARAARYNDRR